MTQLEQSWGGEQQPPPRPAGSSLPRASSGSHSAFPAPLHRFVLALGLVQPKAEKTSPILALGKEDGVLAKE